MAEVISVCKFECFLFILPIIFILTLDAINVHFQDLLTYASRCGWLARDL